MEFEFVPLGAIDLEDRRFEIKKFAGTSRLPESLDRFGILDPVWLYKKGTVYVVIDGFKRLQWVLESSGSGAFCRIFPETLTMRELWVQRVEKKLFEPEMDLAEKTQIISALLDIFPEGELDRRFLRALNVSARPEILSKWARLAQETECLQFLASGETAERTALAVADWDRESRAKVLEMLRSLRCSASIQVEIVERVDEIAIRTRKQRIEVMNSDDVRKILDHDELNHRQKTQALRDLLTRLRNPRLTQKEERFRECVEALGLPTSAKIIHPPAFEGNNWKMEFSFSGAANLRSTLEAAREVVSSGSLDAVLETRECSPSAKGRDR